MASLAILLSLSQIQYFKVQIVTAYYHSHHVHGTMALSPSLKAVVGIDSQDALLLLSPCKVLIRLFI